MLRRRILAAVALATALLTPSASRAVFHIAVINEVMTSYNGDNTAQFVEIRMLIAGQSVVNGSVLGVFDNNGVYIGDALTVPTNIANGSAGATWIMATTSLQTAAGITADFTFTAALPVGGGMVCWGKPADHTNPVQYVDCLAYGTCGAGCSNGRTGTPTTATPDEHSLQRNTAGMSFNNATDFYCADPATPQNNSGSAGVLPALIACPPPPPPPTFAPMPTTPTWSLNLFSIALLVGGALILWGVQGITTRPR